MGGGAEEEEEVAHQRRSLGCSHASLLIDLTLEHPQVPRRNGGRKRGGGRRWPCSEGKRTTTRSGHNWNEKRPGLRGGGGGMGGDGCGWRRKWGRRRGTFNVTWNGVYLQLTHHQVLRNIPTLPTLNASRLRSGAPHMPTVSFRRGLCFRFRAWVVLLVPQVVLLRG